MHRVWIVEQGDKYEGFWLVDIFKRQRDADKFAKELKEKDGKLGLDILVRAHEVK